MKISGKQKIHNHFDFMLSRKDSWEKVASAENVVLDDLYTSYFYAHCRGTTDLAYIALGINTTEPTTSDTGLKQMKIVKAIQSKALTWDVESHAWKVSGYIELNSTEGNGLAFSEVGIQSETGTDSYVIHVSRALIKDANGHQISITKSSTEKLRVYATVYIQPIQWSDSAFDITPIFQSAEEALRYWPMLDTLPYKTYNADTLVAACITWATHFKGISQIPCWQFSSTYSGHATGNYNMWRPDVIPTESSSLSPAQVGYQYPATKKPKWSGKYYLAENRIPGCNISGLSVCISEGRWGRAWAPICLLPLEDVSVDSAILGVGDGVATEFALPHARAKNLQIKINGSLNTNYTLNTKSTKRLDLWSPHLQNNILNNEGVWGGRSSYFNAGQSPAIPYKDGYLEIWRTTPCPGYYFGNYVHEVSGELYSEFVKFEAPAEVTPPVQNVSERNNYHCIDTSADGSLLTICVCAERSTTTYVYKYDRNAGKILKFLGSVAAALLLHADGDKAVVARENSGGRYALTDLYSVDISNDKLTLTKRNTADYWFYSRGAYMPYATPYLTDQFIGTYSSDTAVYKIDWGKNTITRVKNVATGGVLLERAVTIAGQRIFFRCPNMEGNYGEAEYPPQIEVPKEQSITFATPPATGASITAVYSLDYLPKDANWTMDLDFSLEMSRGY